ncbi:MAG: hypothetical protein ACYC0B_00115 [Gemmatimonadaceae bacterium]
MTARRFLFAEFAAATAAMATATWFIAWWTVPVVAALWALSRPGDRTLPLMAAAAGTLSWLVLLLLPSSPGAVARLAEVAGSAIGTGPGPLLALTLAFPALLAASAASLAKAFVSHRTTASSSSVS